MSKKKLNKINDKKISDIINNMENQIHQDHQSPLSGHLSFKDQYEFSEKQLKVLASMMYADTKVVFVEGVSGTAKTFLSIFAALKLIDQKKCNKIMYVRSLAESASKSIGALKGPQPLFAKIMTPNGWTTMGEIQKGDEIMAYDGTVCKVLETYDQGESEVFKVGTNDGRETYCCDNHAWFTQTLSEWKMGKHGSIKSFLEIRNSLYGSKDNKRLSKRLNHAIPFCAPIQYNPQEYIIQPYTMGALLGDGWFTHYVGICSTDYDIPERVKKEINSIGCDLDLSKFKNDGSCISYTISSNVVNNKPSKRIEFTNIDSGEKILFNNRVDCLDYFQDMTQERFYKLKDGDVYHNHIVKILQKVNSTNPIKNEIIKLGLYKKRANEKFIPEIYKYGSVEQRIALLNGLMDTDGCASGAYSMFYTASPQLASDVVDLVRSLGGTTNIRIRDRGDGYREIDGCQIKHNYLSYECRISLNNINPFFLKRKADKYKSNYLHKIKIESCQSIGTMQTKCIKIDHPSHLYITDDFIVTHNTMDDKLNPFLLPLDEKIEEILHPQSQKRLKEEKRIQGIPINFLRGASIRNTCAIIDEAQDFTFEELVTVMTRIGEDTKFFIVGDPMQSDIGNRTGFKKMIELFNDDESASKGISYFKFTKEDIVRSGILRFIMERIENGPKKEPMFDDASIYHRDSLLNEPIAKKDIKLSV